MPINQPNNADEGYAIPFGASEVTNPEVYQTPEVPWYNRHPQLDGFTVYDPERADALVCSDCGGLAYDTPDHGRIVIYLQATAVTAQTDRWTRFRVYQLVPAHMQCINYCEGHNGYTVHGAYDDTDNEYCNECENDRANCDRCEDRGWTDDMTYDEDESGYFCSDCYSELEREREDESDDYDDDDYEYRSSRNRDSVIQSYSYQPTPVFRLVGGEGQVIQFLGRVPSSRKDEPFLGFELETNCRYDGDTWRMNNDAATYLANQHDDNYLYIKQDGSISGFEIVSHPTTVEAHRTLLKPEALREIATNYHQSSWSSVNGTGAGLHVHISKASFTKASHIQQFQMFHYRNSDTIKKFAGRDSRRWASFEKPDMKLMDISQGSRQYNRYSALNFQNGATIELRYFRGSLQADTVFGVLEFVNSMWKYSKVITSKEVANGGLSWSHYRGWLDDEYSNLGYQYLIPLMEKRGV